MNLNAFKLGAKYPVFTKQITPKKDPVSDKWMMPAYATAVELIPEKAGHQRYLKDDAWHYIVDNIGTDYWLADGSKHMITELGEELPEGALLEEPPKPEPTFEQRLTSDPLYMEWQYDGTAEAEQKWRDKVAEIKERYPLPTE